MKKILIIFAISILASCSLNNNPTSKVEELLGKYQGLSKEINYDYTQLLNGSTISSSQKKEYEKIIKNQYKNMSYEIKEEKIDGEIATITTEVEVLNYKNIIEENMNTSSDNLIQKLKNTKSKTTYTIDFTVSKDKKGNWSIDSLSEEQHQKLLGIY